MHDVVTCLFSTVNGRWTSTRAQAQSLSHQIDRTVHVSVGLPTSRGNARLPPFPSRMAEKKKEERIGPGQPELTLGNIHERFLISLSP